MRLWQAFEPVHPLPSATELEVDQALAGVGAEGRTGALCLIRHLDEVAYAEAPEYFDPPGTSADRLARLKARMVKELGEDCVTLRAQLDLGRPDTGYQARAEAWLFERIIAAIDQNAEAPRAPRSSGIAGFVGREAALNWVKTHIAGEDPGALVVTAPEGGGKTAFLAKLAQSLSGDTAHRFIFQRCGADAGSTGSSAVLSALLSALGAERPPKLRPETEAALFAQALQTAAEQRRLVLLLDGIDRLAGLNGALPPWLPSEAPPGIRLVLSVTGTGANGATVPEAVALRLHRPVTLPLAGLSPAEANAALNQWLADDQRTLTPAQHRAVLDGAGAKRGPLALRLSYEETKALTSYAAPLPVARGIEALVARRLSALDEDDRHGRHLVAAAMALLSASRQGLSDTEMQALLGHDLEVVAEFRRRHPNSPEFDTLPPIAWARLRADLRPLLTEVEADGAALWQFSHARIARAAQRHSAALLASEAHRALARHFEHALPSARGLSEAPYYQSAISDTEALARTVGEPGFLLSAVAALGVDRVRDTLESIAPTGHNLQGWLKSFVQITRLAMSQAAPVLRDAPSEAAAQIGGRLAAAGLSPAFRTARPRNQGYLWPDTPSLPQASDPVPMTLPGHAAVVSGLALTEGRTLATASHDGTVRLWSLVAGTEQFPRLRLPDAAPIGALCAIPRTEWLALGDLSPTGRVVLIDQRQPDRVIRSWTLSGLGVRRLVAAPPFLGVLLGNSQVVLLTIGSDDTPDPVAHPKGVSSLGACGGGILAGTEDGEIWRLGRRRAHRLKGAGGDSPVTAVLGLSETEVIAGHRSGALIRHDGAGSRVLRSAGGPRVTALAQGNQSGVYVGDQSGRLEGVGGPKLDTRLAAGIRHLLPVSDGEHRCLAVATEDQSVRISSDAVATVHTRRSKSATALASGGPDGALFITSDGALAVAREDCETSQITPPGSGTGHFPLAADAEGRVLTGSADGTVALWRLGAPPGSVPDPQAKTTLYNPAKAGALAPCQPCAALCDGSRSLQIWHTEKPGAPTLLNPGHSAAIAVVLWTEDGLLTVDLTGEVRRTLLDTGTTAVLGQTAAAPVGMALGPAGPVLWHRDGQVTSPGRIWRRPAENGATVVCGALSPDGTMIACGWNSGRVTLSGLSDAPTLASLTLNAAVLGLAFLAPDLIAATDGGGAVHHLRHLPADLGQVGTGRASTRSPLRT